MNAHVETPRSPGFGHTAAKAAYRGLMLFVLAVNVALIAYIATTVLPKVISIELGRGGAVVPVSPSPSPSVTPSQAPAGAMGGIGVLMPSDADCSGCHSAPGVTLARPDMAHPLAGWEDCTSCHSATGLVQTAPGHTGIHKDQCLNCHAVKADQSAAPVPHHSFNGTACTSCHGNQDIPQAPLPTDMVGKTNCWVCHGLSKDNMLGFTPAPTVGTSTSSTGSSGSATYPLLIGSH